MPWFAMALSIMATQASAVTFISTTGQSWLFSVVRGHASRFRSRRAVRTGEKPARAITRILRQNGDIPALELLWRRGAVGCQNYAGASSQSARKFLGNPVTGLSVQGFQNVGHSDYAKSEFASALAFRAGVPTPHPRPRHTTIARKICGMLNGIW